MQPRCESVTDSIDTLARVRVITAYDLDPIIRSSYAPKNPDMALRLARYLSGESTQMRYDTSKFVEAIIRLRHVGSGIPVLRIDWDALLNNDSLGADGNGLLSTAIPRAVEACEAEFRNPGVSSFMCSGGYRRGEDNYDGYATRYATRVAPGLPIDVSLLREPIEPEDYVQRAFDPTLADRFFDTLGHVGADVNAAVTSGALLCMSDTTVLDLPPFSNLHSLVSWIDDHLRYSLHQALGQFAPRAVIAAETDPEPGSQGRIRECEVHKQRHPQTQDVFVYTLNSYLPALFRGCILDAWLGPKTLPSDRDRRPGSFPRALREALQSRVFPDEQRARLRSELIEDAKVRASLIRSLWSEIRTDDRESIACAWANGRIGEHPLEALRDFRGIPWFGWGLYEPDANDLRPAILEEIVRLAEDIEGYIDWALTWPGVAASIRAWPRGSLRTDLEWQGFECHE